MKLILSVIAMLAVLAGCGESSVAVSRADYGEEWPFSVEAGVVDCVNGAAIFKSGDKTYALNGVARANYTAPDAIWRDNPENPGAKISLGPLISLASEQCD